MEIKGERMIDASRQVVWEAINDAEILKACIPGCESIERMDSNQMKAVVLAQIGPVKARFTGKVTMADVAAPTSCTLHFEGVGGPAGFAKGQSSVVLHELEANRTSLVFNASAAVGGKLGQVGGRLIESAARAISDEFFNRLTMQLSPAPVAPVPDDSAVMPGSSSASPSTSGNAGMKAAAAQRQRVATPASAWYASRWVLAPACLVLGFVIGKLS